MRQRRHNPKAFTLGELLIAVMLLGVVGLVATRTFRLALRTTEQAQAGHTVMMQWEQMTRLLRQDMWGAQDWSVAGEGKLTTRQGDGTETAWSVEEDGTLSRGMRAGGRIIEQQRWSELQRSIRFTTDEGQLLLTAEAKGGPTERPVASAVERLRLPCALKLMQEARP